MTSPEKTEAKLNRLAQGKRVIRDNLWYGVIAILSVAVLVFFPLIGSDLPLSVSLPDTAIGWIVYIFTKLAVAAINICIFHGFMEQGLQNVSTYWKKCMADEILHRIRQLQDRIPMSPEEWLRKEYTTKGISITITSVLSCIVLSQVILSFDLTVFISYLLTLLIGLVAGVLQLYKAETYWSLDYYDYAIYVMNLYNKTQPEDKQLRVVNKTLYEGAEIIYEYT